MNLGEMMRRHEHGNVIIEFALLVPILLILAFAGLEISRAIRYMQFATAVSREIVSVAYRDCTSRQEDPAYTGQCLDQVQANFQEFANRLIPGSEICISVYRHTETGGFELVGRSITSGATNQSDFDAVGGVFVQQANGFRKGNLDTETIKAHHVVAIGEAFVPYRSLLQSFLLPVGIAPRGFVYDVTLV